MLLALAVGAAGAVGAVARYLLDGAVQDRTSGLLPFGTLTVNVIGSLILGVAAGIALRASDAAATSMAIVGTGFCGGFTTWSTVTWETVRLVEEGAAPLGVVTLAGGLVACLLAAGSGLALTAVA